MKPEKNECFEIELTEPTSGATLGPIIKVAVTITNDEGVLRFNLLLHTIMHELIIDFCFRN